MHPETAETLDFPMLTTPDAPPEPMATSPIPTPCPIPCPIPWDVNRPGTDPEGFAAWVEILRAAEAPNGPIEEALLGRVVQATRRLNRATSASEAAIGDTHWIREEAAAERALSRALAEWRRHRAALALAGRQEAAAAARLEAVRARIAERSASSFAVGARSVPEQAPEPAEASRFSKHDRPEMPPGSTWRDYIGLDLAESLQWPVVLGTRVIADDVAGAFLRGYPLATILRMYKVITWEQMSACIACEAEGFSGPWPDGGCVANPGKPGPGGP